MEINATSSIRTKSKEERELNQRFRFLQLPDAMSGDLEGGSSPNFGATSPLSPLSIHAFWSINRAREDLVLHLLISLLLEVGHWDQGC